MFEDFSHGIVVTERRWCATVRIAFGTWACGAGGRVTHACALPRVGPGTRRRSTRFHTSFGRYAHGQRPKCRHVQRKCGLPAHPRGRTQSFEMKDSYSYKQLIAARDSDKGGVNPTHKDFCKNKTSK